jgi:hypothetical protein
MDTNTQHSPSTALFRSALLVFLAAAGFFLWTEHRAHLLGVLPYLIFLLCPAMHFFMHRGHHHDE